MIFDSPTFLYLFLPLVLLCHSVASHAIRNSVLLSFSLAFYAWGDGFNVLILLLSILLNYVFALLLTKIESHRLENFIFGVGIAANLTPLLLFKYGPESLSLNIFPLGISFFTFQGLSYLIDVKWGSVKPQTNLLTFALYVALFPQLLAGPIIRYKEIEAELCRRELSLSGANEGARRFIVGLGKKAILGDSLALYSDRFFSVPQGALPADMAWLGVICFGLQLYFDFGGYSDMAIGLGRMLGFRFPENFNYPFVSRSLREFWSRWHLTLTNWFRTYTLFPMTRLFRTESGFRVALLLYFVLVGLWHAGTLNFLLFGLFHGTLVLIESKKNLTEANWLKRIPHVLGRIYCLSAVLISLVLFRAESSTFALLYIRSMLGLSAYDGNPSALLALDGIFWALLFSAILFSLPLYPVLNSWILQMSAQSPSPWQVWQISQVVWLLGVLLLSQMWIASSTHRAFIYFRF